MLDSETMNTILTAFFCGFIASIIAIIPMVILGLIFRLKEKSIIKTLLRHDTKCIEEESRKIVEAEMTAWRENKNWLRTIEVLSIICIYPALIANAIFRWDHLGYLIIIPSCIIFYSMIAFFVI